MTAGESSRRASRAGANDPALDGIRGLAILLVMIYHQTIIAGGNAVDAWFVRLVGVGWCGVDCFFVLSGFLITGILLRSKQKRHYFRNFYARRTVRIFPLYYAVLLFSLVILPSLPVGIVPPQKLANFGRIEGDEIFYWLYLSNYSIAWAGAFRHGILDISWSLAIEEQFYLMWPMVVRQLSARALIRLALGLVVGVQALRVVLGGMGVTPLASYVLTVTRLDGLAVGAALACIDAEWGLMVCALPARIAAAGAFVGLFVMFCVRRGLDPLDISVQVTAFTLWAILFGALLVLVLVSRPGTGMRRLFELRMLREFGKYSYALYLFHLPLRALLRDSLMPSVRWPTVLGSAIPMQVLFYVAATSLAFAAAFVSYHCYEKHWLKLKRHFEFS